jgi:diaminopimelate epimerase
MTKISFVKMQGLGNDFVVIDDLKLQSAHSSSIDSKLAVKICDRRFGVGADQILWLRLPKDLSADARMEILNADGSIAEMCGNGIRAVALYLDQKKGMKRQLSYRIETLAGMKTVAVHGDQVTVDMGSPALGGGFDASSDGQGEEIEILGQKLKFFEVSMGNPHAVFFVQDFSTYPVEKFGPLIEAHPRFPRRTNVEFVRVLGSNAIEVQVWERGAGITLACGTGACASAVASLATGRVRGEVEVHLPGGNLQIHWLNAGESVMMKGPAVEVFRGEICF